jgi:hypothetical protein
MAKRRANKKERNEDKRTRGERGVDEDESKSVVRGR